MGKLRIGGAWSGVVEVELDQWTVPMLREELARRSHSGGPQFVNLISAGRVLRDGDGTQNLSQLGVKNNAKILVTKVSGDHDGKCIRDDFLAEEERSNRLYRLKAAATSLVSRHVDGSLPVEDFDIELENQSGEKVKLGSETDQRAVMMGLMLQANAKALIRRQQYRDALEVLSMGEEAFSLCNPKLLEMVDNVSILQIDMVWCYFMLRDITWLSEAGIRLAKAREGIERAHGKESTRLRFLQGGRYPEIALQLRMELLEGVVAYHSGQFQKSKDTLASAQKKYFQLQIPDEALSLLLSMGYKEHEAKRALRMSNLDVGSAIDFLIEQKAIQAKKHEDNLRRQKEILEQKRYGMTSLRKAVDLEKLNNLTSIGFEKGLAAEALRRNENDNQRALDDLTNPETNAALQSELISRKNKRLRKAATSAVDNLAAMGFDRASVESALRTFGSEEEALNHLLGQPNQNANAVEGMNLVNAHVTYALGNLNEGQNAEGRSEVAGPSSSQIDDPVKRDVEMEDELTEELQNTDAYSDYDIEVTKEGEAITEYLSLLSAAEDA